MRLLLFLLFALPVFSCKDKKYTSTPGIPGNDTGNVYRLESTQDPKTLFYPVFELSPKTTAFVIDLDNLPSQVSQLGSMDTVLEMLKNQKLYDTLGAYKLVKNDRLETKIKKYFNREYYIYGTRGNVKTKIKDIVFGLDECRTNFCAFCIDNSDITSIGHPMFCSEKLVDLHYSNNYRNIEKNIDSFLAKTPGDYSDSTPTKVFGNVDNFYFTYSDDFLWGPKPTESKCKFPARGIYRIEGNSISRFWEEDLDLFGIPCD
jgi:hypothetical protein